MTAAGMRSPRRRRGVLQTATALALLAAPRLAAQPEMPPPPVGYTEVVNHEVRQAAELTGSVEARTASVVASEVGGLVVELAAREGQRVRRGQPLVKLRRQEAELRLQAEEGQLREAEARLQLAEGRRARARQLFEEQVISSQELDDALSEVDAWQGRVSQLTADVARLRDDLERTVVRAPFSGVVVEEHTAVGEWLDAGGAAVELVDTADLEVTVKVPEALFDGLTPGGPVEVEIAALGGERFEGKIRAVVPRADPQARTFPVKIAIPNPEGRIGVGMLAKTRLPLGTARATTLVPKDAVVATGSEAWIFLIGEDDTVRRADVLTGQAQGAWIAVQGEVRAGDRVVTQGNERLAPGMKVDPRKQEYERP